MELKVSKINTSKKIYLKLVLSIIFIIFTSGFNYDTSVQKIPSYMLDKMYSIDGEYDETEDINLKDEISQEEYKKTIEGIEKFVLDNHILFDSISRQDFSKECKKAIQNEKAHTIIDTQMECKRLISSLRQGHFGISNDYYTEILPIRFMKFKDGYYIYYSENNKEVAAAKILDINGVPIKKVIEKVSKYFYGENKIFTATNSMRGIMHYDFLKKENIVNGEKVQFKLEKNGKIYYKEITPIKTGKWKFKKIKSDFNDIYKDIGFENIHEVKKLSNITINPLDKIYIREKLFYLQNKNDSLIIHFNSCTENDQYSINKFEKELNDNLKTNKPSKIIIDVRFNTGGHSYVYSPILKEIALYKLQNPRAKIKLLIGNLTYSAGGEACINTMRNIDNIEIIGTDSSSTINNTFGINNVFYISSIKSMCSYGDTLIRSDYTIEDIYNNNYKNYDFIENMITPDFHAEQSFADYMIGNDPSMNYALRDEGDNSLFNKMKSIID